MYLCIRREREKVEGGGGGGMMTQDIEEHAPGHRYDQ